MKNARDVIWDHVERTPFIDTHEHLIEESRRVLGQTDDWSFPCDDWALLFHHYLSDDLAVAGMPEEDRKRFYSADTSSDEKYRLVAPWWELVKHTGYGQSVRYALRMLYGEEDLTADSAPRIAEKYRELIRPGLYKHVLREKANIDYCQVNSLERSFMETEQPELLRQDLSTVALSTGLDLKTVLRESGRTANTLDGWLEIIGWHFASYGPRAVAVKNQSAYNRRLNYDPATPEQAEPLFTRHAHGDTLNPDEWKTLQDFLMRYCVTKATEYGLPTKLHTGFFAGHNGMDLSRVSSNAGDLYTLLRDFPEARFVLMHIGYPYQDAFIALAKHYRNVTIDMCWAWIINPAAGVRFVKEFLMAAPANKLLTFGGDYLNVEPVCGHSRLARLGMTQALTELVEEGWLALEETNELIDRLMNGNACEIFPERERAFAQGQVIS